jgi:hypothetical protein
MTANLTAPYEPANVETELWFLERDPKHVVDEKPFKLRYDPGPDIPRSNCRNESVSGVTIYDIRGREAEFSIDREGFAIGRLHSKLKPEDFDDEDKIKNTYYDELKVFLKKRFGCHRVEILEHGVSDMYLRSTRQR